MFFTQALTHYFFPSHTNNQKAKILHSSTLFIIVLLLVFYQAILQVIPFTGIKILGYAANIPPSEVIEITNKKREEIGLNPLEVNDYLRQAARAKGEDMLTRNYWAHVAPDGTQPWKFFIDAGYNYRYAGENLARDFADPSSTVEAWMSSLSHRENMLSSKYKEIGVAVVEGELDGVETTIIVQLFGTQFEEVAPQLPIARAETSIVAKVIPTPFPLPTEIAVKKEEVSETEVPAAGPVGERPPAAKILISPFSSTRSLSLITVGLLCVVLIVDGLAISSKKIVRIGGRTFAHLAFLGMVLAIAIIAKAGKIL